MIIVTYNSRHVISNIIENVLKINKAFNGNVLFVIVDNGSNDGTYNELVKVKSANELHNVILIRNHKNLGFAFACLKALLYVKHVLSVSKKINHIILMNPDIKILNTDILKVMIYLSMSLKDNVIIGVTSLSNENIEHLGIFIDVSGLHIPIFEDCSADLYKKYLQQTIKKLYFVDMIRFFLVLIPLKVIDNIGFMEVKYFMYMEDTEYCLRSWKNGYPCVVLAGDLHVDHVKGGSSRTPQSFLRILKIVAARNHLMTMCKHCLIQCLMTIMMHIIGCKKLDAMYCSVVAKYLPKVLRELFSLRERKILICGIHNELATLLDLKKYRLFWLMKCILANLRSKIDKDLLNKCWKYSVLMCSTSFLSIVRK